MTGDHVREPGLDAARGFAVLGMVWMHLVPGEGGASLIERGTAALTSFAYGKVAVLFCVLAGTSWAIQSERARGRGGFLTYVARRAGALALAGVVFGRTIWPTEILSPLALMMVAALLVMRLGTAFTLTITLLVLAAVPWAAEHWGDYAWSDWNEDGTRHLAEDGFGWVTVRYYLYTGNYPLLPWLAFPLLGALLVRVGVLQRRRAFAVSMIALPLTAIAILIATHYESTWVPTTLPFVVVGATSAVAVIAGAVACAIRTSALVRFGQASLTHYLLHIVIVFVPLRAAWPDEDWSITVGLVAALAYAACALPLSAWWFRRFRRGPFEGIWALASGRA